MPDARWPYSVWDAKSSASRLSKSDLLLSRVPILAALCPAGEVIVSFRFFGLRLEFAKR